MRIDGRSPEMVQGEGNASMNKLEKAAQEHVYISTACYHGLHDRCRQSCKFCSTPCRCSCGHKAGNVEAQLKGREWAITKRTEGVSWRRL